jgi:RNase P subunit RPR2
VNDSIEIKESEWYLRDFLYKQFKNGKNQFEIINLINQMLNTYLRYRNYEFEKLYSLMENAIQRLKSRNVITVEVIENEDNKIKKNITVSSELKRWQCSRCYYISYLSKKESKACLRCLNEELYEFPRKKS